MRKLLIIKTGTTFEAIRQQHGDFEEYIIQQIGIPAKDVVTAPIYVTKSVPPLTDVSAVIITGSHAMVTDRDEWSRYLAHWLKNIRIVSIPTLGICYGHQLIADAWGGTVNYHPNGKEVGTVTVELTEAGKKDALLGCLPERFLGHVMHAQTVTKLPCNARILAKNSFESHQAFVIDENVWGVQFHPEFNADIMRSYIHEQSHALIQEGYTIEKLNLSVIDHSYGQLLLRRFISLVQ